MASCCSCGVQVEVSSSRANYVKCSGCKKPPRPQGGVSCLLCGITRSRLGKHLRAAHGITDEEYQSQFPGAQIEFQGNRTRSSECREKQALAAKKRWESPEAREEQAQKLRERAPWKGKTLSAEHRKKISESGTGQVRVYSEEERFRRGERGRRALEELRKKPNYRQSLSAGQKERVARGELVGFIVKERIQKSVRSRIRNGTLNPQGAGRGICGFRKEIPHYTRSTLEANFARVLLHEGIPYEYEPTLYRFSDGSCYTPDFRLLKPLSDLIPSGLLELKGWRNKDGTLPSKADEKLRAVEQEYGEKVFAVAMCDQVWKKIEERYSGILPWESAQCNLRKNPELFSSERTF